MCRLYGFLSNWPTKVECSLVYAQNALMLQSRRDLRGVSHADGWGLAYYHGDEFHLTKDSVQAYGSLHFAEAAARAYAEAVVAHVRRATVGEISVANTHPFHHGSWTFAHNGTLAPYPRIQPRLARETAADLDHRREGNTDSEAVFYWLLTRMRQAGVALDCPVARPGRLERVVRDALTQLIRWADLEQEEGEQARLNLLLTDGRMLIATCYQHTLYMVKRDGVHDCEICGIPHVHEEQTGAYRATVVASEPVSHESWEQLPDGSVLLVENHRETRLATI